eukprot:UN22810
MKNNIGARDSELFLCAAVPPFFETAKLCASILMQAITLEFPQIGEETFNAIRRERQKGMTTSLLETTFNLTEAQVTQILDYHNLQDTLQKNHNKFEKEKALKLDGKEFFGHPLKVTLEERTRDPSVRSKAKTRLFIKNIPTDKTEEEVKALFTKFWLHRK